MSEAPSNVRLEMCGISKRFGATVALAGVDLRVRSGEVVALVGENGAGKSTLMKVLSGAHRPDAGRMWVDGRPFAPTHPIEARRRGVAMIYQELSLSPHLTVQENILLGLEPTIWGWIDRRESRRRVRRALEPFEHAGIDSDRRVGELTVACQQMVEIARALAVGCRILVLDEPTSTLTQPDVDRLFALVRRLRSEGLAVVYISHFLEEVKAVADRIVVLRDGQVAGEGAAADLTAAAMVSLMVGREVRSLYPRSLRSPGEVVLEVSGLGGLVKPVSATLELRRGEVFGVAGLLGAGRTEFLRCLFGLDPVRCGTVRIGVYSGPASPRRRWRQGVGYLSEDRKREGLAGALSLADNLTLSHLEDLGPWGMVLPGRQRAAARNWIERLHLRCQSADQPAASLSGGNQQKVALARLLHHGADVLLLDEPTRGIDVASKAALYAVIDELAVGSPSEGRPPKAVVMVSSHLPELLGVCDRVAVMCRGRLGMPRPVAEWDEHALLLAATGQAAAEEGKGSNGGAEDST
ncbi:MAG TPA: sugar ABC transporter ATP-binding protein [Verrucomicrobiota bacterium]|nr:sugar ABC transporter ATP-binding protein [Verrucomicrobiota bacterium]HNU49752.1 sugar ABC transporter ATP-binding protein [Verrucomicrobiota bacterium]